MRRDYPVRNRRGSDGEAARRRRRPRFEPLHLEQPFHDGESDDEHQDANDERHPRAAAITATGRGAPSSYLDRPDWLRFWRFLQIGIAVRRQRLGGFERL